MKKIKILNYFKGFSIISIILYHLIAFFLPVPSLISKLAGYGGAGVHLFFFCSGLGLYLSYLNTGFNLKKYIKKRFWKTYIPYIIIITISLFIPFLYINDDRITAYLSHILLFKMFIPKYEMSFGIQMWFMSTIFQLYIVYPLILLVNKKIKIEYIFGFSCIISVLWSSILSIFKLNSNLALNYCFLQYLWEFVFGMFVAYKIYNNKNYDFKKIKMFNLIFIFIVSFIPYGLMAISGGILKNFNDIFSFISFTCLALIFYKSKILEEIFSFFGRFSFEIYLLHILIFSIVFHLLNFTPILNTLIALILTFTLSYFYNYILNKGVIHNENK